MKKAYALRVGGRMRRGRPRLRWSDCVKRYIVGVEWEWITRARDRGDWRQLVEAVVVS